MQLEFIDILLLPIIFFIGVITSYEDVKSGKIRNKWLKFGLYSGLFIYASLMLWNIIARPVSLYYYEHITDMADNSAKIIFTIPHIYFIKVAFNSFISLLVGYLLWKYNKFAAGDAKLFFIFTFLLPLKFYWRTYLWFYPAFILLLNIFTVVFFYLLIRAIIRFCRDNYSNLYKFNFSVFVERCKQPRVRAYYFKKINAKAEDSLLMLLWLITLFLLLSFFSDLLEKKYSFSLLAFRPYIIALFIIFKSKIRKFLRKKSAIIITTLLFLLLIFFKSINNLSTTFILIRDSAVMIVVFMLAFQSFIYVIDEYNKKTGMKRISMDQLKAGDVIGSKFIDILMKDREFFSKKIGEIKANTLNEQQAEAIKKRAKIRGIKKINIYSPSPFAIWLFIGVLLTILTQAAILKIVLDKIL